MKILSIVIPYPISVNKMYYNRNLDEKKCLRGRGLTKEAIQYKKYVAELLHYSFLGSKFGDSNVKVTILDNPPHRRLDSHNGLKIVFDAIQLSGIINNDKQIVAYEVIPGAIKKPPVWNLKIEAYNIPMEDTTL